MHNLHAVMALRHSMHFDRLFVTERETECYLKKTMYVILLYRKTPSTTYFKKRTTNLEQCPSRSCLSIDLCYLVIVGSKPTSVNLDSSLV